MWVQFKSFKTRRILIPEHPLSWKNTLLRLLNQSSCWKGAGPTATIDLLQTKEKSDSFEFLSHVMKMIPWNALGFSAEWLSSRYKSPACDILFLFLFFFNPDLWLRITMALLQRFFCSLERSLGLQTRPLLVQEDLFEQSI